MNTTGTCTVCGDLLELHIGHKPCTGGPDGSQEKRPERRARHVREYERKVIEYYYGKDA